MRKRKHPFKKDMRPIKLRSPLFASGRLGLGKGMHASVFSVAVFGNLTRRDSSILLRALPARAPPWTRQKRP